MLSMGEAAIHGASAVEVEPHSTIEMMQSGQQIEIQITAANDEGLMEEQKDVDPRRPQTRC